MGFSRVAFAVAFLSVVVAIYRVILAPVIYTGGVFRKVDVYHNQNCHSVEGLEGCEKMVHHIESGLIYLACARMSSRLLWLPPGGNFNASGISLGDGHVATYDISTGKVTRLRMKDYPGHLAPHGMDVVPSAEDPTKLYVYVVNHRAPNVGDPKVVGGNSVVDVFETKVGTGVLKYLRTVEDTIIHTPNDVLGFPDGKSFYVTNDHAFKLGLPRKLELYLNRTSTSVGYCHSDHGCKIAADKVKGANGIVRSRTNSTIYVGSQTGAGLYVFEPHEDYTLLLNHTISGHGMPIDNLSIDKNGALWAAYFPQFLGAVKRLRDLQINAASATLRFTANADHKDSIRKYHNDRIFEDDGSAIQGATSVVYVPEKKKLFMHGLVAPHMAICNV